MGHSLKTHPRIGDSLVEVQAPDLAATLRTGCIQLPLASARLISTNAIPAIAASGGILASDTAPALERTNGATDKSLRVKWAASGVAELQFEFAYPPDLDDAQPLTVKLMAKMAGATDTPTVAVGYWEGVGGANAGGNTGALGSTMKTLSVVIPANSVGAAPNFASITLIPAAHGTDALYLYNLWVEYTRK